MRWLLRVIAWRSNRSVVVCWTAVITFCALAIIGRFLLGTLYGGVPSLTFYPMLLVVAVIAGWKEALIVLVLSLVAGLYLFLPPGQYLVPVGWMVVGSFTIVIVHGLKTLAQQLAEANERQRVLFREVQHRVANTFQSIVWNLDGAKKEIDSAPEEAKVILDEAIRRIMASADIHRRLNDPKLFERGLAPILRDAVAATIAIKPIDVSIDIETMELTFDQMSVITMLVMEFANNAQKYVFERNLGRRFSVTLRTLPKSRAVLSIRDDGPGWLQVNGDGPERTLGLTIIRGLAIELGGCLTMKSENGTDARIEFPTLAPRRPSLSNHRQEPAPATGSVRRKLV
jgi:two-component sensor histidine kinase